MNEQQILNHISDCFQKIASRLDIQQESIGELLQRVTPVEPSQQKQERIYGRHCRNKMTGHSNLTPLLRSQFATTKNNCENGEKDCHDGRAIIFNKCGEKRAETEAEDVGADYRS